MTDEEAFEAWLISDERRPATGVTTNRKLTATQEYAREAFLAGRASAAPPVIHPSPEGETVEVRVAVAINTEGEWSACGQCDIEDADAARIAVFDLSAEWRSVPYILVARLPIPREPELIVVDAKVEARE